MAIEMLTRGLKKHQIKAAFLKEYGTGARTVERYLQRARAVLRAESGKDTADHVSESYGFYRSVLNNANATVREKILAQECIDKLLGLRKPFKVAATDAAGNDIPENELDARKQRLVAAIERIKQREAIVKPSVIDQLDGGTN